MRRANIGLLQFVILLGATGCHTWHDSDRQQALARAVVPDCAPRELSKVQLPHYRIEPPDIIDIEAVRLVPKSSYQLKTLDSIRVRVQRQSLDRLAASDLLFIRVPGAPAAAPIDGTFLVQPNGAVSLGTPYGSVPVAGLTLDEAETAIEAQLAPQLVASDATVALTEAGTPVEGEFTIELDGHVDFGHPWGRVSIAHLTFNEARERLTEHFARSLGDPVVTIGLIQASLQEQIIGEHLVAPDGTVSLGIYGTVSVVSLTLEEAQDAIEQKLSEYLDEPQISVTVFSYNSKVYYIVTEGGGLGDAVYRFPITGNDTVLDAISLINGLSEVSSSRMWISRPTPHADEYQVMPVDWKKVTSLAATETNYQLLPGDRLYVAGDPLVTLDNSINKFLNPIERIMGFSILGAATVTRFSGKVLRGGGNPRGLR